MEKIIFIEGISGAGKTTTAQQLSNKLLDNGYNVNCYLEGDHDNPLDPFNGTYPPKITFSKFSEIYIKRWQDFIDNKLEKNIILILDGTLFHHQINDLICEYSASDEIIVNHIFHLLDIIKPLNPIVFYLLCNDVEKCLRQARISRKQTEPTEEKIVFWKNRKRIDLYVLEKLSVEFHIQNIDNGWNGIYEKIMSNIKH